MVNRLGSAKALPAFLAVAAAFQCTAASAEYVVDYDGYTYTLDVAIPRDRDNIFNAGWYGKRDVAEGLAKKVGFGLGIYSISFRDEGFGAQFIYNFQWPPKDGFTSQSFCSYLTNKWTGAGVRCEDGVPFDTPSASQIPVAIQKSKTPINAAQPIDPNGNVASTGSGNNLTANLGPGGSLLPQFQGGTLSVSSSAVDINTGFTLGSLATNAIDAAGNNATFSGVFSDQAGASGTISFTNSSSSPAALTLSAQSTYTGPTGITGTAILLIGKENALPQRTLVSIDDFAGLKLQSFNQAIGALDGGGSVDLGSGTLTLLGTTAGGDAVSSADLSGAGALVKAGGFSQTLNGALSFTGPTTVQAGTLEINGSTGSAITVDSGGTLSGSGVISGNINNSGTVSPGSAVGSTLTIENGSYSQSLTGVLDLKVNGTDSTLLQLIGSSTVSDLSGSVKISGTPTAGVVYTGISGPTAYQGKSTANADTSQVVIAAGYQFCREDDACFQKLSGQTNVDRTKLQFGWVALDRDGKQQVTVTDPKVAIDESIKKGGPVSRVVRGAGTSGTAPQPNQPTLQQTCVANTADPSGCKAAVQGPPAQPPNQSLTNVAASFDGGNAAVASVVNSGVTGGAPIPSATGTPTGYTTNQAKAAGLPSDFVTVLSAVNSLPTRSAVISSLHQVTAEPYASMQSVALEAMEQFRFNALALSRGDKAIRLFTDAEVCRLDDGTLIPASSEQRPTDCKPRKISQASRWSLLIDATNTQASLNGTDDLASLDYNIFQSTYGLQYDASKQWSVGAAFGYGQANLYNYEYANSTINSNTYGGGLWGIYRPGDAWKITGLLGYMNLQYDSSRQISFGGINRNAWANWSGNGFTTAIDVQYDWILSANKADRNAIRIKPNTYLSYSLHNQGSITESGADSLNLAINGHTADSLIYGIGFTVETPLQLARSTRLIPRFSVGYEYDFNGDDNEEHQLTASFADVPALGSLDVLGQNRGANDLNVGLSLELETSDQFSLYAGVGGSFWSNGNEINYGGGLRWRFGGAPKATVAKAPLDQPTTQIAPAPSPQPTIRGLW